MTTLLTKLSTSLIEDDLENQVRALIQLLQRTTKLESAYFTRIDLEEGVQHIVYAINSGKMKIEEGLTVPWNDTLCKRALEQQQYVTSNVGACWGDSLAAAELGIQTYMSAPVNLSDGKLYGTVCAASTTSSAITEEHASLLALIGKIIGMQVDRENLLLQLTLENHQFRNVAMVDPLTGVGNRRALEHEMQRALANTSRTRQSLFTAYIDLDNFKQINDNYGHDAGDRFLLGICDKLNKHRREGDFVARIGGDEFVVFGTLTGTITADTAAAIQQQLFATTVGKFNVGPATIDYAGASIGVAISQPDDNVTTLLNRADNAMYKIKKQRKQLVG